MNNTAVTVPTNADNIIDGNPQLDIKKAMIIQSLELKSILLHLISTVCQSIN